MNSVRHYLQTLRRRDLLEPPPPAAARAWRVRARILDGDVEQARVALHPTAVEVDRDVPHVAPYPLREVQLTLDVHAGTAEAAERSAGRRLERRGVVVLAIAARRV